MTMQNMRGPFLAVVPLSTVPNWIRSSGAGCRSAMRWCMWGTHFPQGAAGLAQPEPQLL